ncbi:DeoR/GlpR transcriptional regulator [Thermoactinomyces intermedius]|uniref:DeoR/GlpR transcriptional regulator n=1 Tax=Thermoactinomyces intermedius TaxID=2024 RepID=A0A8I1DFI0_THEIN|nr:DeoR/GlpR transcriptional regulator [Thermoactinomyces intermedius]MBA4837212.1 DeoR/GlpR transcriptional regulator [Thermoactinomyces intermedius]MBH8596007.1 DeoR/GlpR transcriptional regulator [Thermoactinomyces intermedius]MBH8602183.1 DeoR/GlpR transcriptional regulator [Thermoactinomyces sp. CICC 23799]
MLKQERHKRILEMIEENMFLKVNEAARRLGVTEMTIRRDFQFLEEQGRIIRVHGGARKKPPGGYIELSHDEKKTLNIREKKYVAKKAAELIKPDDTVFIGPGTTTELIYDYIQAPSLNVITNSITIFNKFQENKNFHVVLVGGRLRERTKTFVGYFAGKWIRDIKVQKAFIGTNGIADEHITTADEEEGALQRIVLENSAEKYVVADSSKFGVRAFQIICHVQEITGIITDPDIPPLYQKLYKDQCQIIC